MTSEPRSRFFRQVDIADTCSSRLYLHSMPGVKEPWESCREEMRRCLITRVICLAPFSDIENYSWSYARAIKRNIDSWKYDVFEIPDQGIPTDPHAYLRYIIIIAKLLSSSPVKDQDPDRMANRSHTNVPAPDNRGFSQEQILIHCLAGIGRSGTFAIILLLALGYPRKEAYQRVRAIGSGPESQKQKELIDWCESELKIRQKRKDFITSQIPGMNHEIHDPK